MKDLVHKFYEPFVGAITALWAFDRWEELVWSVILAFAGGSAAYLGKQLMIWIGRSLSKAKGNAEETN